MSTSKVLEVIKKIDELPTLPHVIGKIIELANSPHSTAEDLNKIIRQDQVLVAKTLKLVNSAFYGYSRQITKVTEAVVILGFNVIKNLALSVTVCDFFKDKSNSRFKLNDLWTHSVAVAVCSTVIARRMRLPDPEELFIMGLMHDLGIIVEHQYFQEEFNNVLEKVFKENLLLQDAERKVIGLEHAMIGKRLIEKWKLPNLMSQTVGFHHQPEYASGDARIPTCIVYLSDIICRLKKIGFDGDVNIPALQADALATLGFEKADIKGVATELDAELIKAKAFMELAEK